MKRGHWYFRWATGAPTEIKAFGWCRATIAAFYLHTLPEEGTRPQFRKHYWGLLLQFYYLIPIRPAR